MLEHAQSRDAVFTACLRLFREYPLAVRRHYAEHRYGSMVLASREGGTTRFSVLIMEWDDLFIIRPWDRRDGTRVEIRRRQPVTREARGLIESGVPVPRDGALLGWVTGRQVHAILLAYGRLPEPWDDASAVPGIRVMPLGVSQPAQWPPLMVGAIGDGRLWEYLARDLIADLSALVSRRPGRVFWAPGPDGPAGRGVGSSIVVTERLCAEDFWLPAGVYADHRVLREGSLLPTAGQLLAQPGLADLARGCGQQHLLGV